MSNFRHLTAAGGKFHPPQSSRRDICWLCLRTPLTRRFTLANSFRCPQQTIRFYAKEASAAIKPTNHAQAHAKLSWPTANKSNPYELPSPYEIFRMAKGDEYKKQRFYELVKLYHPDRAQYSAQEEVGSEQLSQAARLERYRMVIAANELLSDPRRRRAYDKFGIGWDGKPEFGPSKPRWADVNNRRWSGFDDNVNDTPNRNATWEDWERWHMRQERTQGEQREVFTSNGTFVVIIILAAGFATVGESVRMHGHHRTMIQQVENRHDENSKELLRRRQETHDFGERDERTRRFLSIRGPVGMEVEQHPVGQEKEGTLFVQDEDVGAYQESRPR